MSRWGDASLPTGTPWPASAPHSRDAGGPVDAAEAAARWPEALKTPCYVFDPDVVRERYQALREALGGPLLVSLKANPNPDLFLRSAHAFDDGIEVASPGELELAVGRGRHDLYLNNPALADDFLCAGIASRGRFVVDGPEIGRRVLELTPVGRPVEVILRINVGALLGRRAPAAWTDHFGMTPDDAGALGVHLAHGGLRVIGLHAFAGSHSFRIDADRQGDTLGAHPGPLDRPVDALDLAQALAGLADSLSPCLPEPLRCLNLGGGFDGQLGTRGLGFDDLRRYRQRLAPLAARYRILHEAGRAIYADAGDYLTRVTALKRFDDRIVAVCDGGLSHNFLLAGTESTLKNWRAPRRAAPPAPEAGSPPDARPVVFIGNTCHRSDVIGRWPPGSVPPRPGQLVVFDRCGAYHATYTMGSFLSHRPARIYIRQGSLPTPMTNRGPAR